jgi:cysteine desulfurase
MLDGGGQEQGLRPGTLNTPAIVGFGQASQISLEELPGESVRIRELRNRLERQILSISTLFRVNGPVAERLPNTSSILFPGIEADALLANASQLALSLGSACSNGAVGPSHVLKAIGLSDSEAYSTVRFSIGRFSTDADVDVASSVIASVVKILHPRNAASE